MAFVTWAGYRWTERGRPLGRRKKAVPMELSFSAALAFAVTVVLTLTLRPLALLRITDKPGGRKRHIGEICHRSCKTSHLRSVKFPHPPGRPEGRACWTRR